MPTNKEIIEAAYASFAVGDVPAVLAVMDPKIEWTEAEGWPLYDGTFVGPQAIVDGVFMRLGEIGDNFSLDVTQLVAEGDTVVAFLVRGRCPAEFLTRARAIEGCLLRAGFPVKITWNSNSIRMANG